MSDKPHHGPESKAVALNYQSGQTPKISAKAQGEMARQLIELAQQEGIFIHQDALLTDYLSTLNVEQEIPESLYLLIAELISFAYLLQGKFPEKWTNLHGKVDFEA